jgi:hypothetical protein
VYEAFLRKVEAPLNAGRQDKFQEERAQLRGLPSYRYEAYQSLKVTVSPSALPISQQPGSTIEPFVPCIQVEFDLG